MVSYGELKNFQRSALATAAEAARNTGRGLDLQADLIRDHARQRTKYWPAGDDAVASGGTLAATADPIEVQGENFRRADQVLDQLAETLAREKSNLQHMVAWAEGNWLRVAENAGPGDAGYSVFWDDAALDASFKSVPFGPALSGLPNPNDPRVSDPHRPAEVRDRIDAILERATDADRLAATDLYTGGEPRDVRLRPGIVDGDVRDGEEAAAILAQTHKDKLGKDDMLRLQELLKENAHDHQFATTVLNKLGPQGLLKSYGSLGWSGDNDKGVQEKLGRLLGLGTDSSKKHHVDREWLDGMTGQLDQRIDINPDEILKAEVSGAELLAPLLQYGRFDTDVQLKLANEIFNRSLKNFGTHVDGHIPSEFINPTNPSYVGSPANSVLAGLRDNPEAAAGFLYGPGTAGRIRLLMENSARHDAVGQLPKRFDSVLVGQFLYSAATGKPWDERDSAARVAHTPAMRSIAEEVIKLATDALVTDDTKAQSWSPTLASIALEYREDIAASVLSDATAEYLGLTPFSSDGKWLELGDYQAGKLLDHQNTEQLSKTQDLSLRLRQLLQLIGRDPSAANEFHGALHSLFAERIDKPAVKLDETTSTLALQSIADGYVRILADLTLGELEAKKDGTWEAIDRDQARNAAELGIKIADTAVSLIRAIPAPIGLAIGEGLDQAKDGLEEHYEKQARIKLHDGIEEKYGGATTYLSLARLFGYDPQNPDSIVLSKAQHNAIYGDPYTRFTPLTTYLDIIGQNDPRQDGDRPVE